VLAIRLFLEAAETGHPFAAVILDLTVPGGLGGRETLVRFLEIEPEIRAIASSGYSVQNVDPSSDSAGFAGFLPKPYSLAELGRALGELLADGPLGRQ
jgi:CheY-like chemotaxis protein